MSLTGCARRASEPSARIPLDRNRGGAVWGANFFPNIPLVSHRGDHTRFFDLIQGKVVAVNFIYTTCSDSCPMETARMVEVQNLLGERMGKDIFFYSITIDPERDTEARLKEYAELWHAGPGWSFLTGKDEDITVLRKQLGVYEPDRTKRNHDLGLLIGNQQTGRWMRRSTGENPYVLATQLGSWLHNWKLPSSEDRDYANAPEVRNISVGEELFRARCSSCHTVGADDTSNAEARRVGPDLLGVTKRRERAWLERWIMHPDQMLAEKDPLAIALLAQHKNIVMPNLRFSRTDTAHVLEYLDGASQEPRGAIEQASLPPRLRSSLSELLTAYEAIRERLAADDLAGALAAATPALIAATEAAAQGGGAKPMLLELAAAARAVTSATEVSAARSAFGELSRQLIALLQTQPELRQGRLLFTCPMASGYKHWLQTSAPIDNPYMGKRMPRCGIQQSDWSAAS